MTYPFGTAVDGTAIRAPRADERRALSAHVRHAGRRGANAKRGTHEQSRELRAAN